MSPIEVRAITPAETIPLRHATLRAGLPRETAIFPGDDAAGSRHYSRHGFKVQGGMFDIPTAGPHFRMLRPV